MTSVNSSAAANQTGNWAEAEVEQKSATQKKVKSASSTTASPNKDEYQIKKYESFDDMDLPEQLLRGIYGYGFENPSHIQKQAIMPIVEGRDVIAQAQSGSGKTGTFTIGILAGVPLNKSRPEISALVLAPTRELALQIHDVCESLSAYMNIKVHALVGGQSVRKDIQILRDGVHVVIGTPGRVMHMLNDGHLDVSTLRTFVLDEADEMLSRGFKEAVYEMFREVPSDIQVALLSATMPPDILELTQKFMRSPVTILVKAQEVTLEGIAQFYIDCSEETYKLDALLELYELCTIQQSIIFCNTKKRVIWLLDSMAQRDFTCVGLHGDMTKDERHKIMQEFRRGEARVLISTNLTARGIDVQGVSLVINYDIPPSEQKETYIHRIGRSGRYGRKGVAINFITPDDEADLRAIQKHYDTTIEELSEATLNNMDKLMS